MSPSCIIDSISFTALARFSHDLPVMISVVDTEEKLAKAVNEIEPMMQDGIIVFSDVEVIRLVHSRPPTESSHANG